MRPRRVVVSGGAGALGQVLAASMVDTGAEIHLVDRVEAVVEVAERIGAVPHCCDLTDEHAVAALPSFDEVGLLVNGVGAWPLHDAASVERRMWDHLIEVNLTAAFLLTQHLLPGLRKAGGSVVNVASAVALKGNAQMVAYATAKAGLLGLTRSLARALGGDGVRVNAVAPGFVRMSANDVQWAEDAYEQARQARAIPDDLLPSDLVGAIEFLGSPGARMMTGQTLVVDGGVWMGP